jgi:L-fuconolactonase
VPTSAVIDAHLHLWDTNVIRYPWLDDNALLNRPYLIDDYCAATESLPIEAMVFIQCEAEPAAFEREAAWVSRQAKIDPRIRGMVAWAPLEKGYAVTEELTRLRQYDILRGIRRIIQFEPDPDFCLRAGFIDGVRSLKEFGLSFDICVAHHQMGSILKFVERVPEVQMILDHLGKPPIRAGKMSPWVEQLRALARFPHVMCKISGATTEAHPLHWTPDQLKPYIDAAIEAFGFKRILFGGDWPVSTQAVQYERWVSMLDDILAGVDTEDQHKFWRENAIRVYRLSETDY